MTTDRTDPNDVSDAELFADIRALADIASTAEDPSQPDDIRELAQGLTENVANRLSDKYNR
ncbi:hypothetical protein RKE29_10640 [Streptomyces sp. B1866]|uniref:hypothetical protein n=1 Tax=Streptomyces sp. B1866 TaxID=3075431 RepID=UPI00288D00D2|nr:hypothetical protein [Streptomyces sp. B1866]MDT3397098.1 hypothetical protein [Streptomyces sp. B1866]